MINKKQFSVSSWVPNRPISKGATAYHDAVVNTSWHSNNIKGIIKILKKNIKNNDIVIDFGAGTGASAIYYLQFFVSIFKLYLVDNSPSWLGKAYEILNKNKRVSFLLLEKKGNRYLFLDEIVGTNIADHVISANTVHLIPNILETFQGIHRALKKNGTFTFQSGNILFKNKTEGVLMIEDTINKIHDIAIKIIKTDNKFKHYRKGLSKRQKEELFQRRFVFPMPRPIEFYVEKLKSAGFRDEKVIVKNIKVTYKDWMNFLRVRRLQAGILPEIGGKEPTVNEEVERDIIITKAATELFKKLQEKNPLANKSSFTVQWIYVYAIK